MNNKELSVIVPVYNTEKYLIKCLNSIIKALTFMIEESQIIVVNDGSQGNLDEIMQIYIEKYNNLFSYIKQENKGPGGARATGIKVAEGNYISFIDPDDYIDEKMYKEMFIKMKSENADIVVCDFETIDKKKDINYRVVAKNPKIKEEKWACFDVSIMPSSCNKIFRKELFEGIHYPERTKFEDLAITPILMLKAEKISYLPKMYYKYYIREGSIMHSKFEEKRTLQMMQVLENLYQQIHALEYISNMDKQRAFAMVYTKRFFEDILEPTVYIRFNERKKMLRHICEKISPLQKQMVKNEFYLDITRKKQKKKRKLGHQLLDFMVIHKMSFLLAILFQKKIFYHFFFIDHLL